MIPNTKEKDKIRMNYRLGRLCANCGKAVKSEGGISCVKQFGAILRPDHETCVDWVVRGGESDGM